MRGAWTALWLAATSLSGGCTAAGTVLEVVDERGAPVADAWAMVGDLRVEADEQGRIRLRRLDHPVLAIVSAPGALDEPVTVGATDLGDVVPVPLLDDGDGRRIVIHSTGDVMLGRRYQDPISGRPVIVAGDGGVSARAVVSDAAPALSLADFTSVNLETVVGDLPPSDAYPGKRYLLQSPPDSLAALDAAGVDMTVLANNHQRDWMDEGVEGTLDHLDARGMPRVGAALEEALASEARVAVTGNGARIGMLAWTSVDGDFVNDAYPPDWVARPADVNDEDAWQWIEYTWGEPSLGVEVDDRRIGGAWEAIVAAEPLLDADGRAALWESAVDVYPSLQDWVARRGHGGAARWDNDASPAAIAALRPDVDVLVVNLHMGFQFASAPGDGTRAAARAAIDAGADLVVAHHPHVLQGVEWYKGKLIAYSLGNFIFDQDFLSTFRTAFLRTVWEDGELVQARIVPMFLDAYRPVPVADALADETLRALWDGSLLPATTGRGRDLGVRAVADDAVDPAVTFRLEHHTVVVTEGMPAPVRETVQVPCGGFAAVPPRVLTRARIAGYPGLLVGRVLDGLGSFEDEDADVVAGDTVGWTWESEGIALTDTPFGRDRALALSRNRGDDSRISARMVARVPLTEHRLWLDAEGDAAADGPATYSVRIRADRSGSPVGASVRLALYHFDDLNPTEDPESTLLGEVELPFEPVRAMQDLMVEIPASTFAPIDGVVPNAVLVHVSATPPGHGAGTLRVWDLGIVEWRDAAREPDRFAAIDLLRDGGGACGAVAIETLPL